MPSRPSARPTKTVLRIETLEDRTVPHGPGIAGADLPEGVYTAEQLAAWEQPVPVPNLSTKTPPAGQQDGSHEANILTFVLDFKESGQGNTSDIFGNVISAFDVTAFGFSAAQFNAVAASILSEVDKDYFNELAGTVAGPSGQDLRIDFIIGDIGTAPAGLSNYYYVQIGSGVSGPHIGGPLGVAGGSVVRNTGGFGPNGVGVGDVVGSVFTDVVRSLGGLSPSNALSSGNFTFTAPAVAGTLAHEIGHTLSLSHITKAGSTQAVAGLPPVMGTGAIDLPNQDRIGNRAFSLSGVDGESGNAPRQHVQQLATAVGLHDAGPPVVYTEDFGDAPASFGTTLAGNGARHTIGGPRLGAFVDGEADATGLDGTGDDVFGDDEDGVVAGILTPGDNGVVTVTASAAGVLNAWVDFNGDGDFGDANEHFAVNRAVAAGATAVTVPVPFGAPLGRHYARFRITSAAVGSPSPVGLLLDGEVEDHALNFSTGTLSENFDGVAAPTLPAGWTATGSPAWVTDAGSNVSLPNSAFVANFDDIADSRLTSPVFAYAAGAQLVFRNLYNVESDWDGGVLEIAVNDGVFTDIETAGGAFVTGGYNDTLNSSGNPLGGRRAWSGDSAGFITTTVNLPASAAGQLVQMRWRLGSDSSQASVGWRIDNVNIPGFVLNVAPVITSNGGGPTAAVSILENTTAVTTVTATDANVPAQTLSYAIAGGADAAKFSISAGGALRFVTAPDFDAPTDAGANNVYDVVVRVTDNGVPNKFDEQAIAVSISPLNSPPTLTPITAININEDEFPGGKTVNLLGISDGDADKIQGLTVTAVSNNLGLVPNPTVTYTSPNDTGTLVFTPAANGVGSAVITVRVEDDGGTVGGGVNFFERQFTVTIAGINDPPTLTTITDPAPIFEDAGQQSVPITGISPGPSDEASQIVTVTAESDNTDLIPFASVILGGSNRQVLYTPLPNAHGTAVITVRAKDNGGGTDEVVKQFTVVVLPRNETPAMDAVANPAAILEDAGEQSVSVGGVSPGPTADDAGQTVTVTATSGNTALIASVSVEGAGANRTLKYTPVADAVGTAVITVKAQDDGGTAGSATDFVERTFTVTVTAVNDAPTLDAIDDPDPIDEDSIEQSVTISGVSPGAPADEAGQGVAVTAASLNSDLIPAVTITGNTLTYTPAPNAHGTAVIRVRVEDTGGVLNGGVNFVEREFTVAVTSVNEPPLLDAAGSPFLAPVSKGTAEPAGTRVADFAVAAMSDPDGGDLFGMAVIGADATHGHWDFSTDGGATWEELSPVLDEPVSAEFARKLRAEDRVRFVPNAAYIGSAQLTYRAWDQTDGAAGDVADLTDPAADISVSSATETATVRVAPVFATVPEDKKSDGHALTGLQGNVVTDTPNAKRGFAVVGAGGALAGKWEYMSGGWKPFPAFDPAKAMLLKNTDKVRFLPAADQSGEAYLIYRAWDQSTGKAGTTVNLTAPGAVGGATPFSAVTDVLFVRVTAANDNPVLDAATTTVLTPVLPGDDDSAGDAVADILGATATDADPGTVPGLAVTAVGKTGGHWEFFSVLGTWKPVGAVSAAAPLLLGPADLMRFVPDPGFSGPTTFSYMAWDRSAGTAGSPLIIDKTTASAVSKATVKATLLVTTTGATLNAAPVLDTSEVVEFPAVPEDAKADTKLAGRTVAALLGDAVSDDDGALPGIAVTGLTGTATGTWQYSTDGKAWKLVPAVSPERALLLKDTDSLRYVPKLNATAPAAVTYVAWDRTRGTAGQLANVALPGTTGGTSPFGEETEEATVAIIAANDAPVLNTAPTVLLTTVALNNQNSAGDLVSALLGSALTDVDAGALKGIAVTKAPTGPKGRWEFKLAESVTWDTITVPAKSAFFLKDTDRVRFVPAVGFTGTESLGYRGWDQTDGPAGVTRVTAKNTSVSVKSETAKVVVGSANVRPVLDTKPDVVLPPTTVNAGTGSPGFAVSAMLGGFADPDAGAVAGIAVTGIDSKHGTWQFQIDGVGVWRTLLATTSAAEAVPLKATDKLRFLPTAAIPVFVGSATIKFKAWDRTAGAAGVKTATTGDAFGKETEIAKLTVNNAPTLTWTV